MGCHRAGVSLPVFIVIRIPQVSKQAQRAQSPLGGQAGCRPALGGPSPPHPALQGNTPAFVGDPIPRRPGFQAPLGPASWRRKNTVQGPPSSTAHGPQHTPRPNPTGCRAVPCRATRISFKPSHLSTCFRVFTPFPRAGQPHSLQLVTHPALTELGLQSAGNGLGGFAPQPPDRWSAP